MPLGDILSLRKPSVGPLKWSRTGGSKICQALSMPRTEFVKLPVSGSPPGHEDKLPSDCFLPHEWLDEELWGYAMLHSQTEEAGFNYNYEGVSEAGGYSNHGLKSFAAGDLKR